MMNKSGIMLVLFALISVHGIGQEKITVTQTTSRINETSGNALRVEINRAKQKTIAKEWKAIMKSNDADVDIKRNEVIATEVMISAISAMGISVYAQINEISESRSEFLAIFFNGDRYISSSNDASSYTAAKSMVEDFALELSREATNKYVQEQKKLLDKLKGDLKNLEKEQEKAKDAIADAKKLITDKEQEIELNKKNQGETEQKIEAQKKQLKAAEIEAELFK